MMVIECHQKSSRTCHCKRIIDVVLVEGYKEPNATNIMCLYFTYNQYMPIIQQFMLYSYSES